MAKTGPTSAGMLMAICGRGTQPAKHHPQSSLSIYRPKPGSLEVPSRSKSGLEPSDPRVVPVLPPRAGIVRTLWLMLDGLHLPSSCSFLV